MNQEDSVSLDEQMQPNDPNETPTNVGAADERKDATVEDIDFEPQVLTNELIQEIRERRGLFDSRSDYNTMVCDELMRCGQIPTQKSVLAVGKWGSAKDVSRDVALWRQSFSKRLYPGPLPFAAQRLANQMLAQLMDLSKKAVADPLEAQVRSLEALVEKNRQDHQREVEELTAKLAKSMERTVQLTEELSQSTTLLQRQKDELDKASERIHGLESSVVTLNVEKRQIEASAKDTLSHLEARHTRERTSLAEAHAAQLAQVKEDHRLTVSEHKARITTLESSVESAGRQAAAQIEAARQDAKRWQEQARAATEQIDRARTAENDAREKLASETLRSARLENQIFKLTGDMEALQKQVQSQMPSGNEQKSKSKIGTTEDSAPKIAREQKS